jgi:GNAT superfamily N-acetyltransferase
MRERPALFLGLLADQPELIAEVGVLRWRASGSVGTPGPWIEATASAARSDSLPVTLVAMDLDGRVIGAVTLECAGTTPRVVHLVVRPGERLCGVGRLMLCALEDLARDRGHDLIRVAAEVDDVEFYRHCGWLEDPASSPTRPVLTKDLAAAG